MEARTKKVVCHLEPTFEDLIQQIAQDLGITVSTHLRNLAVNDLLARGIVTQDTLEKVTL